MNTEDWEIVNRHRQIDSDSCIPSCVEMILKLERRMDPDSHREQQRRRNSRISFADYNGVTLERITFTQRFAVKRSNSFPFQDLFDQIAKEITDGKYVAISLSSGDDKWHMWVIYEEAEGEFRAFSKRGDDTVREDRVREIVTIMKGTDILTYTRGLGSDVTQET